MSNIKIVIDSTTREVYIKMLSKMIEILKGQTKMQFYDHLLYKYATDLLDRISSTPVKKKMLLQGVDQIVIAVSLAFNPDITTQHIIGAVRNEMDYFVKDLSTNYVHDFKTRKNNSNF